MSTDQGLTPESSGGQNTTSGSGTGVVKGPRVPSEGALAAKAAAERGYAVGKEWLRLQQAAVGRRSSLTKSLNWVFEHLGVPPDRIDAEGVPSPGAVNQLRSLQQDTSARHDFVVQLGKSLVAKSQKINEDAISDHGEPALELIRQFEAAMAVEEVVGDEA